MQIEDEIGVLNDFKFFYRCVKILELPDIVTKKEICKKTKDTINNINLIILLKFLYREGFVSIDDTRIPHVYHIDKKKLALFLYDSKFYHEINLINKLTNKFYSY